MAEFTSSDQALEGKHILVTGATDGIGRTAAIEFARQGATVILVGRNLSKLEAVYDEIEAKDYPQPMMLQADLNTLTAENAIDIADTIAQHCDSLEGLLHNASQLGELAPIENYKPNLWRDVMQTNLDASFYLTRALLPLLKQATSSSIIFTTSGVGNQGRAYWGAYSVSKFATEGLAYVLADELDNTAVRVNLINPGATRTKMRARAFPGEDAESLKTPEQLMPLYTYLMSDQSKSVNGQRLDSHSQLPI